MFPAEMAAELGIDWNACTPSRGTTASGEDDPADEDSWPRYWAPGVDAHFWGKTIHLTAYFRQHLDPILLGRVDFFANFKVLFDQRNERLSLEPYKKH
jgi:hypothetical protein